MARGKRAKGAVLVRLYVAGQAPNSKVALENVRAVLAGDPGHDVELEIVDVLRQPARAARDAVTVTPTLARVSPPPERRIVGSLGDRAALAAMFGLREDPPRE